MSNSEYGKAEKGREVGKRSFDRTDATAGDSFLSVFRTAHIVWHKFCESSSTGGGEGRETRETE